MAGVHGGENPAGPHMIRVGAVMPDSAPLPPTQELAGRPLQRQEHPQLPIWISPALLVT